MLSLVIHKTGSRIANGYIASSIGRSQYLVFSTCFHFTWRCIPGPPISFQRTWGQGPSTITGLDWWTGLLDLKSGYNYFTKQSGSLHSDISVRSKISLGINITLKKLGG